MVRTLKRVLWLIPLGVLLLLGCQSATQSETPVEQAKEAVPVQVAAPTPLPLPTPTVASTSVPMPTSTPTLESIPTPVSVVILTPTLTAKPSPTPVLTQAPTSTTTPTPSPTQIATSVPLPTVSRTPTTPTPQANPTPTPTRAPTPTVPLNTVPPPPPPDIRSFGYGSAAIPTYTPRPTPRMMDLSDRPWTIHPGITSAFIGGETTGLPEDVLWVSGVATDTKYANFYFYARGKSRIEIWGPEVTSEVIAQGETGAFDFLKGYYREPQCPPPSPINTTAPQPTGPTTKGTKIEIAGKSVSLPDDAYVEAFLVSIYCSWEPCAKAPAYRIVKRKSMIEVSAVDGEIITEWPGTGDDYSMLNSLETYLNLKKTPPRYYMVPPPPVGTTYKGIEIGIAGSTLKLPEDAYVYKYISTVQCTPKALCPVAPIIGINRGKSRIEFSIANGEIINEQVGPGDEGSFNFLKGYLKDRAPVPQAALSCSGVRGLTSKGFKVPIGTKIVNLPDEAKVYKIISTIRCATGESCPLEPVVGLAKGRSRIDFSVVDGEIVGEEIAPGEENIFDFVRPYLKKVTP